MIGSRRVVTFWRFVGYFIINIVLFLWEVRMGSFRNFIRRPEPKNKTKWPKYDNGLQDNGVHTYVKRKK